MLRSFRSDVSVSYISTCDGHSFPVSLYLEEVVKCSFPLFLDHEEKALICSG